MAAGAGKFLSFYLFVVVEKGQPHTSVSTFFWVIYAFKDDVRLLVFVE